MWGPKVTKAFLRLRHKPEADPPFVREAIGNLPRSSDLSQSRKELYRGLVAGSVSYSLVERLGWSMEEIHSVEFGARLAS